MVPVHKETITRQEILSFSAPSRSSSSISGSGGGRLVLVDLFAWSGGSFFWGWTDKIYTYTYTNHVFGLGFFVGVDGHHCIAVECRFVAGC